jgi:hypothetical protein
MTATGGDRCRKQTVPGELRCLVRNAREISSQAKAPWGRHVIKATETVDAPRQESRKKRQRSPCIERWGRWGRRTQHRVTERLQQHLDRPDRSEKVTSSLAVISSVQNSRRGHVTKEDDAKKRPGARTKTQRKLLKRARCPGKHAKRNRVPHRPASGLPVPLGRDTEKNLCTPTVKSRVCIFLIIFRIKYIL